MAKNKVSETIQETKDKIMESVKTTELHPDPVEEKPVSMVEVMFRENRKFDLHIGRKMITFRGRETKKIPVAWVQHKDFQSVKKYFVVKGVTDGN